MEKKIVIKGARENNLKNIDVSLPKDSLIVFSGLSGSGKSTLAFDTIFAEGQRRYMESLSSYARQFLGNFIRWLGWWRHLSAARRDIAGT